ncbi:TPR repeat protein [Oxalobacteraceae bacterium GrIS 1.11]
MANRSYLLNTRILSSDPAALVTALRQDGMNFLEVAQASYRIPFPWLCCFRHSDLRAVRLIDHGDDGQPQVREILLPSTSLEHALRNLRAALPLFEKLLGDAALAREYWSAAVDELRRMPLPFLMLDPCELLNIPGGEQSAPLLAAALAGDDSALPYMVALAGFGDTCAPYGLAEFRAGLGQREGDADYAERKRNTLALDFGGAWIWHADTVPEVAAAPLSSHLARIPLAYRATLDEQAFAADALALYQVRVDGVKEGGSEADTVASLIPLFKRSAEQVRAILLLKQAIIKKDVDLPTAEKYRDNLERCGCAVAIEITAPQAEEGPGKLHQLATLGNGDAQTCLAYLYENGLGVAQDYPQAAAWYGKAAGDGHAKASYKLAYLLGTGQGVDADAAQAAELFRQAADEARTYLGDLRRRISAMAGPAEGQPALKPTKALAEAALDDEPAAREAGDDDEQVLLSRGRMHASGDGAPRDIALAAEWFRKAAVRGNVEAQFQLGALYETGCDALPQDIRQTALWHEKAAHQGHAEAQCSLAGLYSVGRGVKQDMTEAAKWYRKAAAQGIDLAQSKLGMMYSEGDGVPLDLQAAAVWHVKAAARGRAEFQFNLGRMYSDGKLLAPDLQKTAVWYLKAAQQGHAEAQALLGDLYSEGAGVARDYRQAASWYRKAAEQGLTRAMTNLGYIYSKGQGVGRDPHKAALCYRKAAEEGSAVAQYGLATLYFAGDGLTKNDDLCEFWLRKAASQGHADAQHALEELGMRDEKIKPFWRFW